MKERVVLGQAQFDRAVESKKQNVISQQEYDRTETFLLTQKAELTKAESAERNRRGATQERQRQPGSRPAGAPRLEAEERKIRTEFNAQIDGQNPEVRETMALLEKARWDLDQTIVRAPTDGYVPQNVLRPGNDGGPRPLQAADDVRRRRAADTRRELPAKGDLRHQARDGGRGGVQEVPRAIVQGQGSPRPDCGPRGRTGCRRADPRGDARTAPGYIPVVFDYDEDVAGLELPIGSQASVAIYTDRVHALSILRKIVLRIKSWENFVF